MRLHSSTSKNNKNGEKKDLHGEKKKHSVCGATISKLQVDVVFGTFEHFVCLIVTIYFNCNNKPLFVECIVRCKRLPIKLLDEENPA